MLIFRFPMISCGNWKFPANSRDQDWLSEQLASILKEPLNNCKHRENKLMQLQNANTSMRLLFLMIAALIWAGIWLSGYNTVHWVLYLPAAFLTVAAVTGICPGLHILGKIFGKS